MLKALQFVVLIIICLPRSLFAQTWESLSDIPEKLTFPVTAVVDGKIHILGGGGVGGATNKHYQYDPQSNTWTIKAPIPYKAQQPAGTANNGKIHFFGGGFPTSGSPVKDHYVYDPILDTWKAAANIDPARAIHYAVSLNNQLYSMAGQGVSDRFEQYDANNNSWINKKKLPDSKFWYGAHVVAVGKIFRFCGGGYTAPINFAHEYEVATDTWLTLPNMPVAIHGLAGAAIGNKIYLVGGYHDFEDSKDVWVYNMDTKTYTPGVALPTGRTYHNMVSLDACIYTLGGNNAIDATVGTSFLKFCPNVTGSFDEKQFNTPEIFTDHNFIRIDLKDRVPWNLKILDVTGKQILAKKLNASINLSHRIEIQDLPASIYFIQLTDQKRKLNRSFIIIN
ncbi:MAG: T9SS type A sorting domain-containing protein [Saprospiraceae bacterium]|nr:T9SS type A sorting domain-containing protein [Saprospiraceae bacterium]MBK9726639.1 T9SS type A sorting domain-containing protein [Saprospiraceae bacterium]